MNEPTSTKPWVVIPTYNERANISKMVDTLFALSIANLTVLIVDDSSPDGTGNIVTKLQKRYQNLHLKVRAQKKGIGRAYIDGFQYALERGATAIVQMDADFSHDPTDIPRLLAKLKEYDLVLGSRYVEGINVVRWPLKRLLISIGGNMYASTVTGLPFKDATGGFKAWRAQTLKTIDIRTVNGDGYGFQIVTTFRAWRQKLRIIEIPIVFTERTKGASKMNNAIIWEAIWLVWKLRIIGK